jgi:hypothetical protein
MTTIPACEPYVHRRKLVEAGRIELPSEETNDKEHSCFSNVHLCLVACPENGRR